MLTALACMTTALFFEARSEDIEAQRMIGEVIMNRVEDPRYPDTVCDVVFEKAAFSFTMDGKSDDVRKYTGFQDKQELKSIRLLAKEILKEDDRLISSTHYHEVGVSPYWKDSFTFDGKYGAHVFYTNETPYK